MTLIDKTKNQILEVVTADEFRGFGLFNMVLITLYELTNESKIEFPSYKATTKVVNSVLGKESGSIRGRIPRVPVENGGFEQLSIERTINGFKDVIFDSGKSPLSIQENDNNPKWMTGWRINIENIITFPRTSLLFLNLVEHIGEFGIKPNKVEEIIQVSIRQCLNLGKDKSVPEEYLSKFKDKIGFIVSQKYLEYDGYDSYLIVPELSIKKRNGREVRYTRKEHERGYLNYLNKKALLDAAKTVNHN